jgi:GntR family transcriptional repressor for pyruvate dehydrogenase complex
MDNISNDDLHSMRLILETAGARLAALQAKPVDLERLDDTLEKMADENLSLDERINFDAEFHISVARASGNELVGMFVDVMTILLNDYMAKGVFGLPGIKKTRVQHRRILDAIRNGDPDRAEAAIRDHLNASRENVVKYEQAGVL